MKLRTDHLLTATAFLALAVFVALSWLQKPAPPPEISKDDRAAVLAPLAPDNTEQKKSLRTLTEKLAVESDTLSVGEQCAMEPLVLKLADGAALFVKNEDKVAHTVVFESGGTFVLAPGYTKRLVVSEAFGKGRGVHRYRCDDLSGTENAGVLYVVP